MYKRNAYKVVSEHISGKKKFIQVLSGPRQVGKTTIAKQLINEVDIPSHYASADEPGLKGPGWLDQQWETARFKINENNKEALLILDEIQKLPQWSETVKRLWDEDMFHNISLKVILLGSSQLLIKSGLTESLAGRFEIIPVKHWSYSEMKEAFGLTLDEYIYFGGYPGAVDLKDDADRWRHYINESLIETSVSKDILLMNRVDKPALLRRMFELGCAYSGRILSYQKMIGQLQDAGNTTTLAHYIDLLSSAGFLTGLQKYAGERVRRRASSPKLLVYNTAIMTSQTNQTFKELQENRELWGRWVESAVGAHLLNESIGGAFDLFYWAKGSYEVDFVMVKDNRITAIEVKSNSKKTTLSGIDAFSKEFNVTKKLLVGAQGIPLEGFFISPTEKWL